MLIDLIMALANAKTEKEKEKAYRNLQSVGVDKATANVILKYIGKEK